ncbi:MAG: helix-turn-helix domain-containing protein [Acidobacteria bacterium]|jgi:HTH-type transcriptional regulator/antitoxin HigA|nr:helix-turn-helix domain-containing protein [Acidobacteriota bacterium]
MIRVAEKINPQKYGRLLSRALPVIIKTEEENDRAILIVEELLAKGDKLSSEESVLLELLGKLIADFEEKFYQPREASPQEVLIEMINARGLKQKDLTEVFGSKSRVSEAISGKREISKIQAKALADFFKVSAELFI